jgi:hypothetical protein
MCKQVGSKVAVLQKVVGSDTAGFSILGSFISTTSKPMVKPVTPAKTAKTPAKSALKQTPVKENKQLQAVQGKKNDQSKNGQSENDQNENDQNKSSGQDTTVDNNTTPTGDKDKQSANKDKQSANKDSAGSSNVHHDKEGSKKGVRFTSTGTQQETASPPRTLSPGFSLLGSIISPKISSKEASSAQKNPPQTQTQTQTQADKPQQKSGGQNENKSAVPVPSKPNWKVEGNMLGLEAWGSIVKYGGDSTGFSLCKMLCVCVCVCVYVFVCEREREFGGLGFDS